MISAGHVQISMDFCGFKIYINKNTSYVYTLYQKLELLRAGFKKSETSGVTFVTDRKVNGLWHVRQRKTLLEKTRMEIIH